jgi:lipopolysaccharide heptosyltransferase II
MSIVLKQPPKILITRTDRIGDMVLSTPVFSELRKKFPQGRLVCLTFLENRGIVQGNPFLDEVILYDKKGTERGWWGNLKFAFRLRKMKFDAVVHLHATNRMHFVTWMAGIPVRIGWRRKWAWMLTHSLEDIKKEGLKHEAEYNFELLKFLGIECPQKLEAYYPLPERELISLNELLRHHRIAADKRWVIINPSASCPSKIWPVEKFGKLIDLLHKKYNLTFMTIGSRQDRKANEALARTTTVPVHDLSGRLTLPMLGWLLKKAALLVSNDSGPVHIAAAVGTPVVSIFGRKQPGLSPTRWRPLGENSRVVWKDVCCRICLAHRCQIHFLCLEAVSVEEVLSQVESFEDRLLTSRLK